MDSHLELNGFIIYQELKTGGCGEHFVGNN